jgi:hypothetical protein
MKVLILILTIVFCSSAASYKIHHQQLTIPSDESVFYVADGEDDSRDRRLINSNNATGEMKLVMKIDPNFHLLSILIQFQMANFHSLRGFR